MFCSLFRLMLKSAFKSAHESSSSVWWFAFCIPFSLVWLFFFSFRHLSFIFPSVFLSSYFLSLARSLFIRQFKTFTPYASGDNGFNQRSVISHLYMCVALFSSLFSLSVLCVCCYCSCCTFVAVHVILITFICCCCRCFAHNWFEGNQQYAANALILWLEISIVSFPSIYFILWDQREQRKREERGFGICRE